MDIKQSHKTRLANYSGNLPELLKQFNTRQFARSLLPCIETENAVDLNEGETTYYGEFLDKLEDGVQASNELPDSIVNLENLRVWSTVSFTENNMGVAENIFPQTQISQNITSQNKESTSVELTCQPILSDLETDKVKTEDVIRNFIDEEVGFECSSVGEVKCNNHIPKISPFQKIFRFFYLDAFENLFGDYKTVHLFGKSYCTQTNKYISCCVALGPLKRRLFVLPRSKLISDQEEILKEFYCVALKPLKITKFNFRFVLKKNLDGFESDKILFMEIEYSSQYPPVDSDVEGTSFCKVYGVKRNHFESFLLEKRIKGPCWLDISNPIYTKYQKTWCVLEISCTPDQIYLTNPNLNLQVPPLTILSIYIKSMDYGQSKEIALVSWAICRNYDLSKRSVDLNSEKSYCVYVNPEKEQPTPKIYGTFRRTLVKRMHCEKDLLDYFLEEFNKVDPDILIGYDFQNQEIHNLVDRLISLKIVDFCRLSRFRGTPQHTDVKAFLFSGRLICDMKLLAKELIFSKYQTLEALYEKFLNITDEQRYSHVTIVFFPDDKLLKFVVFSTNEAIYLLKLAFNSCIIPLIFKLSNVCGTSLSQSFTGGVFKRSEFLLLFAFHENGYVLPERKWHTNDICDEELSGGLVLEPKVGFYDHFILLMDFQSLYPSVIQEYNLCLSHTDARYENLSLGVIPSLMKDLIEKRQKVKTLMKKFDKESMSYALYDVYQSALKLSSNGIYGCLGSRFFRFYCPSIVAQIVEKARETLRTSVSVLQNQGFEIIYGDTDSMMINTKSNDLLVVQSMGEQINDLINKKYSSIELKVDSIFRRLLIVGKKKYAGIAVLCNSQNTEELKYETILKGLDVIRGDWPLYVCQMGKVVIDYMLSDICLQDKISKIKGLLNQIEQDLSNHQVPTKSLVITKYLTQDPENYTSINSFPHVQVALRCNEDSVFHFRKGDEVSYVMCCNKNSYPSRKAFHLLELTRYPEWKVDESYYLHKKVYPMISRICSNLEGMGAEIEAIFGTRSITMQDAKKTEIRKIEFERRDPFTFKCIECKKLNVITIEQSSIKKLKLLNCQNSDCCSCPLKKPTYLRNQLVLAIQRYISSYYKYELICRNSKCKYSSRRVPLNSTEMKHNCPACKKDVLRPIFSETDLFLQLRYFRNIFGVEISLSSEQWITDVYYDLLKTLDYYENQSNFGTVNLTDLFSNY